MKNNVHLLLRGWPPINAGLIEIMFGGVVIIGASGNLLERGP